MLGVVRIINLSLMLAILLTSSVFTFIIYFTNLKGLFGCQLDGNAFLIAQAVMDFVVFLSYLGFGRYYLGNKENTMSCIKFHFFFVAFNLLMNIMLMLEIGSMDKHISSSCHETLHIFLSLIILLFFMKILFSLIIGCTFRKNEEQIYEPI
jgi:hypothetical protein